ncbi:MAG: SPOR domain-containing protein, partial [Parvularculaceae bacterium]
IASIETPARGAADPSRSALPMETLWGEGDADAPLVNGWSVQIGAYSTREMAQTELEAAAAVGAFLGRTRTIEPMALSDGSSLFRARFTTLTAADAATVCDALREKSVSCFVVQDGATSPPASVQ